MYRFLVTYATIARTGALGFGRMECKLESHTMDIAEIRHFEADIVIREGLAGACVIGIISLPVINPQES